MSKKLFWVIVQNPDSNARAAKLVRATDSDAAIHAAECEGQGRWRICGVVGGRNADTAREALEEFEKASVHTLPFTCTEIATLTALLCFAIGALLVAVYVFSYRII